MHDAQLDFRLRIHRRDRLGESGKSVHGGHEDVLQPAVLQFVQDPEPELGAFRLVDPEPQELFLAFHIYA